MKKKLASLAVLIGTLLVSSAALSQEILRIYGRLNLGVDRYSATGATNAAGDLKSRTRVYDAGSRLGFEGQEDLGGGLKAIFLLETGLNADNGGTTGQSGAPNPYTGVFNSRYGHVGLQGNWGRLTFGKSNVWWYNGDMEQASVNYLAAGNPGFYGLLGRGMNVNVQRVSNTLQYSALFAGYLLQVSYSPNAESRGANLDTNGKLLAVTAQGQWGPFGAGYDWVKNQGNDSANIGTPASIGHKARAGWQYMPGAMLSFIWVKSVQENGGAAAVELSKVAAVSPLALAGLQSVGLVADAAASRVQQTTWGLNLEQPLGNTIVIAQWAKVNDITGCVTTGACDNTGATSWMVGARLNLSKRTGVYASYATIKNEANYNMDYLGGWMTSASTTPPIPGFPAVPGLSAASVGADPKMFGVGVMHNF